MLQAPSVPMVPSARAPFLSERLRSRYDAAMPAAAPAFDPVATLAALRGPGYALCRGAIPPSALAPLTAAANAAYATLEALVERHGPAAAAPHLPPGTRYQPAAASLGLDAIEGWEALLDLVPGAFWRLASALLPGPVALDTSICWARRQYPPHLRHAGQSPHMLHQDGAYGSTFVPGDALLPMLTYWIPLTDAGLDAPGIECIPEPQEALVPLAALGDDAAAARWPLATRARPVMHPGDILLIAGPHLHRTHVVPEMSRIRTSLELRAVPSAPLSPRLPGHALHPLPG